MRVVFKQVRVFCVNCETVHFLHELIPFKPSRVINMVCPVCSCKEFQVYQLKK